MSAKAYAEADTLDRLRQAMDRLVKDPKQVQEDLRHKMLYVGPGHWCRQGIHQRLQTDRRRRWRSRIFPQLRTSETEKANAAVTSHSSGAKDRKLVPSRIHAAQKWAFR